MRDAIARNALVSGILAGCQVIGRRETIRNRKETDIESANDVFLRMNILWGAIQPLSEAEGSDTGSDDELRTALDKLAKQLEEDLLAREQPSWWSVRAEFKGCFAVASCSVVKLIPEAASSTKDSDVTARRAMVRLCQALFGGSKGQTFFDELDDPKEVSQRLLTGIADWRKTRGW